MAEPFDSDWYMAVNEDNRYSLVRGVARTKIVPDLLVCEFFLDDGTTLFASFRGEIGDGGKIIGTLRRVEPRRVDVPLRGYHFQVDEDDYPDIALRMGVDVSIMLSDGWTTMGIARKAPL